jgi:predicted  nucleic acid-binding Zn-ribbon protein
VADDFILEARKRAVKDGLQRIGSVLNELDLERRKLANLSEKLSARTDQLSDLAAAVTAKLYQAAQSLRDPRVLQEPKEMDAFAQRIKEAHRSAEKVEKKAEEAKAIADELSEARQLPKSALDALENNLVAAAKSCANAMSEITDWPSYLRKRDETIVPIFEDYLDLVEGHTLRSVGYEDGIAIDADEVLRQLDQYTAVRSLGSSG